MKNDVVIGVIYRPPDTDINSFVAIITDILSVIKAERKTCYIIGDFNINLINVSNHIPTAEFLEVLSLPSLPSRPVLLATPLR